MFRLFLKVGAAGCAALVVVAAAATPAFAHEGRHVGSFSLEVGWLDEPTYSGFQNGVQITVKDAKGNPVDDLGNPPTLAVEVLSGTQSSGPLELEPSFDADTGEGRHGEFDAALIPTRPGNYTFHFTGTIKGQKIDEKFTSSDTTFASVKEPTAIEFPVKDPTVGELATSIDRLNPRIQSASDLARSGKDKASTAVTLGTVGVVVGGVAVLLALALGLRSRRPKAA